MSSLLSLEVETRSHQRISIPMSGHMWDAFHAWKKSGDHADFDYLCELIRDRVAERLAFSIVGARNE